ncbi:hypothetical protein EV175_007631, partial [Coemansia sp. RSA 1933]
ADGEAVLALWCITNVAASEGSGVSECALRAAPYVAPHLESGAVEVRNQAAWALGNMAAEGSEARNQLYANGVLQALLQLARTEAEPEVLQTAWFAVSNMARTPSTFFDALFGLEVPELVAQQTGAAGNDAACVVELAWVAVYLTAAGAADRTDQFLETGAVDA